MAEIPVDAVLDKLTSLVQEEVKLLTGVKDQAVWIADEFEQIKAFLIAADEMEERSPEVDVWVKQVRDVADDIEDVLDEYRLRLTHPSRHDLNASLGKIVSSIRNLKARHQIALDMQQIRSRMSSISEGRQRFQGETTLAEANIVARRRHDRRQDALLVEEADLVGIDKPKKELISWLTKGDTGRKAFSVVGMGGLGKTTPPWSEIRRCTSEAPLQIPWITVSESFKMEDLLKDTFQQLYKVKKRPVPQRVDGMSKDQLRTKIKNFLQQKRFGRCSYYEVFPDEIVKLLHLKYLSLRGTKIKAIPRTIGNLQNLETFDLKHTCINVLPVEISQLQKLRHLLVYRYEVQSYAHFNSKYGFKTLAQIGNLRSLQKLCFIEADQGGDVIMIELGKLNQLRRLGIVKFRRENGVALCSSIEKLTNLRTLSITSTEENEIIDLECLSSPPPFIQRLYLSGRLEKLPQWISSLHSLAKLSLKWSQLRDDPLESLQICPISYIWNSCRFMRERHCISRLNQGFQRLQFLGLDKLDELKMVRVDMGALPSLENFLSKLKRYFKKPCSIRKDL
ncbi:Disease resistance protein RPM1 [Morella rubra]|uniref:Disease resistance protein RPM1 n=1 Tax=Morella rubra TaxID=262757 RepID=A0A6A1VTP3_9ROSI|nr:Disease resistance protein RPM1 [Morella rubra]